jgi:hypothetical protein
MFTAILEEHKIKQNELLRQADNYRLVKSLDRDNALVSRVTNMIGKNLIQSGQFLINRSQTGH